MVRCVDAAVYVARTRPQWPANEHPINPATPFKQAACGSSRGARRGHRILKSSLRKLQRHCRFQSIHIEVACDNDGTVRVTARCIR